MNRRPTALAKSYLILLVFTACITCRERYGLPMEAAQNNLLVVEGNVLIGDTTQIKLSRTSAVAQRTLLPERGATIQVEGEDNSVYTFTASSDTAGLYKSNLVIQNSGTRYRIKISTGGKEYLSEWLEAINSPPMDSVYWRRDALDNGVEIWATSHGTPDDARYYKWDYDEVWEFHANYRSYAYFTHELKPNGEKDYKCMDVTRDGITYYSCVEPWYYPTYLGRHNDSMYTCWKYQSSSNITIGSTAALAENVVVKPVRKIPNNAWELSWLYSILVKQTGLSEQGYAFYRIMEGNSEGRGSIFDAQPSEMKTNITCVTKPTERVIGFVDATRVQYKRIFISVRELPDWRYYYSTECTDTLNRLNMPYEEIISKKLVPTSIKFSSTPPYQVQSYGLTWEYCADCRLRGVHLRPAFWP